MSESDQQQGDVSDVSVFWIVAIVLVILGIIFTVLGGMDALIGYGSFVLVMCAFVAIVSRFKP